MGREGRKGRGGSGSRVTTRSSATVNTTQVSSLPWSLSALVVLCVRSTPNTTLACGVVPPL